VPIDERNLAATRCTSRLRRRRLLALGCACLLPTGRPALAAESERAQRFGRIIVPFPAGGPTDASARLIAALLSSGSTRNYVVENIAGAGGAIGMKAGEGATPDGSTLTVGTLHTIVLSRLLQAPPAPPLDQVWAPIGLLSMLPYVLVVRAELPARTLAQLIALARGDPGRLSFGSVGEGSTLHLASAVLAGRTQMQLLHVPFAGTAPALQAVSGGHVDMVFCDLQTAAPAIRSGRVRALAIAESRRWPALPEVPTLVESGVEGADVSSWTGLLAPARTPREVIRRLEAEIARITAAEEFRLRLRESGSLPPPTGADAFAAVIATDERRWADALRIAGIRRQP
jgi:tripartite-type tricarboxylate transporter receptor subunit TctC